MDLKSGYPYWAVKNGLMHAFPPLRQDVHCDVAVLGAGITGALIADELARHGHVVVVVEQRDVGWGSTAASTALLQYEIDTHMVDLAKKHGEAGAVLAYQACASAIPMLQALAADVRDVNFAPMDSLNYASKRRYAADLRDKHALRKRHGFDVGCWSAGACGQVSALTHRSPSSATRPHASTRIAWPIACWRGCTATPDVPAVRAKHLVLPSGYANQGWLKQRVAHVRSSYAIV